MLAAKDFLDLTAATKFVHNFPVSDYSCAIPKFSAGVARGCKHVLTQLNGQRFRGA
jgi:hypothetical protein